MTPEEIGNRLLSQLDQIRAGASDVRVPGTWPSNAKLSDVTDWAEANGLVDLSAKGGKDDSRSERAKGVGEGYSSRLLN